MYEQDNDLYSYYRGLCQKYAPETPMDIKSSERKIVCEMSEHFNLSKEEIINKISIWKKADSECRKL